MKNHVMAKLGKVDENCQIVFRMETQAWKVCLCQLVKDVSDAYKLDVRPGMLLDFPDSEVSKPLWSQKVVPEYPLVGSNGSAQLIPSQKEKRLHMEIPNEALRTDPTIGQKRARQRRDQTGMKCKTNSCNLRNQWRRPGSG